MILAATDFDPVSRFAIQEAWQLATQRADAELHVVHVVHEPALRPGAQALQHRALTAEQIPPKLCSYTLELAHAMDLGPLPRPFRVHVRFGAIAPAIIQIAADLDADLLVVGSHGKHGLGRMLGSVSRELLDLGRLPVLVARPKHLEDIEHSARIQPPCPDCLTTRSQSGGVRWWCDLHARHHVDPHVHATTQVVRYSKPPADFEGYGR